MASHDPEVIAHCVRAYMTHIRRADDQIREIERQIRDLRARLEGLGCPMGKEGGGRSPLSDKMADGVASLIELEERWGERIAGTLADVDQCREICDPAHVWRWALYMHLVEGRTWAYAARVVGYAEATVKLHAPDAMREVYYLMPERFRRDSIPNAMPR